MIREHKRLIITIDGPAGSGKSTTALRVASALGYVYLDSGAMYRAVTLAVLESGVATEDSKAVCRITASLNIEFKTIALEQAVFVNKKNVTHMIRMPSVTAAIGPIAANPQVRALLVPKQRKLGENGALVAEGRDMGTVVFPDADLKIFLIASLEARARRRFLELKSKGLPADYNEIFTAIQKRDSDDSTRRHSPLKMAADALTIDTSQLAVDQQVEMILKEARVRGA
jgi:CMP/dCMP kinase